MIHSNKLVFKNSTLIFEGETIKWGTHILRNAGITHVWLGGHPDAGFPLPVFLVLSFIALSGSHPFGIAAEMLALFAYLAVWMHLRRKTKDAGGIYLGSDSGQVYSFVSTVSGNTDFMRRAYERISARIAKGDTQSILQINFEGAGEIAEGPPETEAPADKPAVNPGAGAGNDPLRNDLQKILVSFSQRAVVNREAISLIETTMKSLDVNTPAERKDHLSQFVAMGLITDCNELGLSTLIDAIKGSVYT